MDEHEDLAPRFRRLREGTNLLRVPPHLVPQVFAAIEQSDPPRWWISELLSLGRWALIPASVAPASLLLVHVFGEDWFNEAVFLASSLTGFLP